MSIISLPSWYAEDVVCVAVVPIGQIVDWSPNSYEPEEAIWPPEGTFIRLQAIASELNLEILETLNLSAQSRLGKNSCEALLSRWNDMTEAVEGTPGAGWVAAMRLLLQRCAKSDDAEVLIEGP